MARNEDGEFELMLGNKQLISLFFLMVALLGVCFIGGYALGRSAAPVVTATNTLPPPVTKAPEPEPTKSEPVKTAEPTPSPDSAVTPTPAAPVRTAPQVTETAPEPAKEPAKQPQVEAKADKAKSEKAKADKAKAEKAKSETAKTPLPAPKQTVAAKAAPASGQPVTGRTYLQLSATDKDKAEVMVDLLRRKNFAAIAAPVAEKPGLFRVLVGPLADTALPQTKAQLKAGGFPGDEAIRRVF